MKTDKNTNFLNESWNGMTHGEVSEQLRTLLKDMIDDIVTAGQSSSVGIADITTSESQEDGGVNTITITLTDGTVKTVSVRNGQSGGMVSTVDTAARAAIMELYRNLAGIAFVGDKPGISFNATSFQVQVFSSNLQGCAVVPYPESVSYGGRVVIAIRPAEGKTLDKVTLTDANIISRGAQGVTSHGYNSSTGDYEIVFDNVIGDINITVQNVTAADIPADQVSLNISAPNCSIEGSPGSRTYLGDSLDIIIRPNQGFVLSGSNAVSATMTGGGQLTITALQDGSVEIETGYVTGDINISAAATAVFSVTYNLTKCTKESGAPVSVLSGSSLDVDLTAEEGYTLDAASGARVTVRMANRAVTGAYDASTQTVRISQVTGNVVIEAEAVAVAVDPVVPSEGTPVLLRLLNITPDDETLTQDGNYWRGVIADTNSGYSVGLDVDSGCTSNNDLDVRVGGVRLTLGTDYTFADGKLAITAAALTGDVVITATAHTGTITVVSDAAVTGGITIDDTPVDLSNGTTTISKGSFGKLLFSDDAKSHITAIDFGGAVWEDDSINISTQDARKSCFKNMSKLVEVSGFVNRVNYKYGMFWGCSKLETIDTIGWGHKQGSENNVMSARIFYGCSSLTDIDASFLVTASDTSLSESFAGCTSLVTVTGLDTWDVSNITTMYCAFRGVKFETGGTLGLGKWNNASKLTQAQYMFDAYSSIGGCKCSAVVFGNVNFGNLTAAVGLFMPSNVKTLKFTTPTPPTVNQDYNVLKGCRGIYNNQVLSTGSIKVPTGSREAYIAAAGWSEFAGIITEED